MERRKDWLKVTFRATVVIMTAWLLFWSLNVRVGPVVIEMAKTRATSIATRAINNAISERVGKSIILEKIMHTEKDSAGRVVFIQVNTGEVNRLSAEASLAVQDTLKELADQEIYIPLGQILGGEILAGRGPKLPVKIVPVGTVESYVQEEFLEQGINQTSYKLHIMLTAKVSVVVPLVRTQSVVRTNIPIASLIIPGAVPQVYFSGIGESPLKQLVTPGLSEYE